MILNLHPAAVAEIQKAYDDYHQKDPNVAASFLAAVDQGLEKVCLVPERYPQF